ncbi:MAG: hypothetical protein KDH09_11690, partial [Chrysiogenetes bacterium]|nr:hypothetical protein [Chrysiogenetes bacterium]
YRVGLVMGLASFGLANDSTAPSSKCLSRRQKFNRQDAKGAKNAEVIRSALACLAPWRLSLCSCLSFFSAISFLAISFP